MTDDLASDEVAPNVNDLQAKLRIAEKKAREAEEKANASDLMARENAFLKAGINPEDAKFKYLFKGYDGDLDPSAIKAEAVSAGLLEAPKPAPEAEALARAAQVAGGAEAPVPLNNTQARDAEYLQAQSQEEVLAIARKYGSPIATGD